MKIKNVREVLKTCAEDTRLRIINLLSGGELSVKSICQSLEISQSVISKHLARLRLARLVSDKRKGNLVYYRLSAKPDTFQEKLIDFIHEHCKEIPSVKEDKKNLSKITE